MKAYILKGIGQLAFMDVPKPTLKAGEVLVEVKAAGICGSDIPRIFETGTYHFPTIPGHEFSGIVRDIYDEEQAGLLGKAVGVFPLIPCMECEPCREKQYEMCTHYDYLGSRRDGGFAEYVAVPARNIIVLPKGISFETAAMLEPASVGIHALSRLDGKKWKTAAVFGPGTIGLLTAQWLRLFGVKEVFILGTNEGQRELASRLGFRNFFYSRGADGVQRLLKETDGAGVELAAECTGTAEALEGCLSVAKRGGDVLAVGNPKGDICLHKDIYWQLLRKQLRIGGTWNSSFVPEQAEDDWKRTLEAIQAGRLKPEVQITHKLPFEELHKGLDIMREKKIFCNKVMVTRI